MINGRLRLLGRFLSYIKQEEPKVKELSEILIPGHCELVLRGIKHLAKFNSDKEGFEHPANVTQMVALIKELILVFGDYCSANKDQDVKKYTKLLDYTQDFQRMFLRRYKAIVKLAYESQVEAERNKEEVLPTTEDVSKFLEYLRSERDKAYEFLTNNEFSLDMWKLLHETTMLSLLVFNRKRVGDIAQMRLDYFLRRKTLEESMPDNFKLLSESAKIIGRSYTHIYIRGKKSKTVSLLIDQKNELCLKTMLEMCEKAGVPNLNPYLFGLPSADTSKSEMRFPEPCITIRKFSKLCGARMSDNLRGTKFRKHIVTICAKKNITPDQREDLAKFLGHSTEIHKTYYRLPQMEKIVIEMSKLLEDATGKEQDTEGMYDTYPLKSRHSKNIFF